LLKNAHLLRYPARSLSRGRGKSRSLFVAMPPLILQDEVYPEPDGGALHPGIFEQPVRIDFFSSLSES
jgi:hypothetical protein